MSEWFGTLERMGYTSWKEDPMAYSLCILIHFDCTLWYFADIMPLLSYERNDISTCMDSVYISEMT